MKRDRMNRTLALLTVSVVAGSVFAAHGSAEPGTIGAGGPAIAHKRDAVSVDPGNIPVPSPRIFDTGVLSGEPTIGIGPDGALYVHADLGGYVRRSTDGGIMWSDITPRINGTPTHQSGLDPYLYVDERTGRIFANDLLVPCQQTSWSDDAGATWATSIGSCNQADHQTIFAGPPMVSELKGYPNVVYNCAINGGIAIPSSTATSCNRSLDGGLTFLPTLTMPYTIADAPKDGLGSLAIPGLCDGGTGHGFVGPDGAVYLPRGWCGQPWLAISHDDGDTWNRVEVATNGMFRGFEGSPAHEAAVVADADGNVYYTWVAENRLPYLAISRDGGLHFETPMMIGPPGLDEASLPGMAIGGSGKIAVTYMGTTTSPGGPFPTAASCRSVVGCGREESYDAVRWNNYITMTTNALAKEPLFFSASMNDPSDALVKGTCGPLRCSSEYDFIDVQIAPDGTPWSVFVDACPKVGPCVPGLLGLPGNGEQYVGRLVGGPSLR